MSKAAEPPTVLALNCGSSSLKFALFRVGEDAAETLIEGEAQAIGTPQAAFSARAAGRPPISQSRPDPRITPKRRGASSPCSPTSARRRPPPSATASFMAGLPCAIIA